MISASLQNMESIAASWGSVFNDVGTLSTEEVMTALQKVCTPEQMVKKLKGLEMSTTEIKQSLKGISNTNTFMIMAINRCIDYVKVNKGLKLTPRNETIDLIDSLSMPMDCMKNIQEKIEIALRPVPKEICTHIITDKQWLQENILCLLSNAVKYSESGEVTISVTFVTRMITRKGGASSSPSDQRQDAAEIGNEDSEGGDDGDDGDTGSIFRVKSKP
jgi:signal transduction histidine kinase